MAGEITDVADDGVVSSSEICESVYQTVVEIVVVVWVLLVMGVVELVEVVVVV